MFTHVMIGTDDIEISKRFYDETLKVLGIAPGHIDSRGRLFYQVSGIAFGITRPINAQEASAGNGVTIGFAAGSREQVDAWHEAGLHAGGTTCEDPPGVRADFQAYAAYLRDPVGNKLCVSYRL